MDWNYLAEVRGRHGLSSRQGLILDSIKEGIYTDYLSAGFSQVILFYVVIYLYIEIYNFGWSLFGVISWALY